MNRRIKKKLQKRLWYKKYSEYRIMRFFKLFDHVKLDSNNNLLYIVTSKKSKNNKKIHSVSLLTYVKPISSLPIMNDAENKTFTLEFTSGNSEVYEKNRSLISKVVNREKPETISLDMSDLESVTHDVQEYIREKIDDTALELLSKPPGCMPFPSDYGLTVKEYLDTWISGIRGGNE